MVVKAERTLAKGMKHVYEENQRRRIKERTDTNKKKKGQAMFRFWWIAFGVREFLVRAGQR